MKELSSHERTFHVDMHDTPGDPETIAEALASNCGKEKKMAKDIVNISKNISLQKPQIRGRAKCHAILKLMPGNK